MTQVLERLFISRVRFLHSTEAEGGGRRHDRSRFVNAFVKSDPRLPFGDIQESGYGRELSSYGIKEFVNIKTVFVR
jgi:hypothetical protein